jgi:hypothetical protein
MLYNSSRALQLLRLGSDLKDATFRDGQEDAIRHLVEGRGRLLVVHGPAGAKVSFTSSPRSCFENKTTDRPCVFHRCCR